MNHPNFPYGKGLWIWYINNCFGGNLDRIIAKCKEVGLTHLLIKCGDGLNTWDQFTPALIKKFHDNNIKVYSWTYVRGDNPLREAAIAMWALDMGADGHVFDAEGEYQGKPESAKLMLKAIRQRLPNAFLAYAPFPIIDYHQTYPYLEFGKYCDAVMPQMYHGDFKQTPQETINWTFEQWSRWEDTWRKNGHADSIKPIIPAGQAYDNPTVKYKSSGADVAAFIQGCKGYKSVNFWSFQHILLDDVWNAIKNNNVDAPIQPRPLEAKLEEQKPQEARQNEIQANGGTETVSAPAQPSVPIAQIEKEEIKEPVAPVQPQPQNPLSGIATNGITIPRRKKQIDYFREFVIQLIRTFSKK
jgi:hypothetical protein